MRVPVIFFVGSGGMIFFCFLPLFPSCSLCVPITTNTSKKSRKVYCLKNSKTYPKGFQVVPPQTFTIAPHFFPKWLVCPKFISHVYKLKRWATGSTSVSIFRLAVQSGASIGECPMFQKNGDGSLRKKNRKSVSTPIN